MYPYLRYLKLFQRFFLFKKFEFRVCGYFNVLKYKVIKLRDLESRKIKSLRGGSVCAVCVVKFIGVFSLLEKLHNYSFDIDFERIYYKKYLGYCVKRYLNMGIASLVLRVCFTRGRHDYTLRFFLNSPNIAALSCLTYKSTLKRSTMMLFVNRRKNEYKRKRLGFG